MPDESLEVFAPTTGRITGVLALLLAAAVFVLGLVERGDVALPVMAAALLGAVVAWAALLKPRVSVSSETLYLRNMLETVDIPLAAVDELVVRQVLAVRVGAKRFVSPAVGRKLRKVVKAQRPSQLFLPNLPESLGSEELPASSKKVATSVDYVDHVEGRLRTLVDDARQRHGVTRYSDEALAMADQVTRHPAWPEIAGIAVGVLLFVVSFFV